MMRPPRWLLAVVPLAAACSVPVDLGPSHVVPPSQKRERSPLASADSRTCELRPAGAMAGDFLWRQRLVAEYPGGSRSYDAIVQKRGDSLVLIGLTPFGTKAFVLTQEGTTLSFEPLVAFDLPFPPCLMLVDIQRSYYPSAATSQPPTDGEHVYGWDDGSVVEVWRDGRLVERRFATDASTRELDTRVSYPDAAEPGSAPKRVNLENFSHGYRLSITTVAADGSAARQPTRD